MKHLAYIALTVLLWSCGSKRQSQVYDVNEQMLISYWSQQIDTEFLTIKGSVSLEDQGSTTSAGIQLRMQRDSVIWASVSIMGMFEGFRVYITTDSVHVLDRINRTYTARSAEYLKQLIGLNVELSEVQNILIGNAPFSKGLYESVEADSSFTLSAQKASLKNILLLNNEQRTYSSKFKSDARLDSISFTYDKYMEMADIRVPSEVVADLLLGARRSVVDLQYRSAKTDSITNFAFTVPTSYKRI